MRVLGGLLVVALLAGCPASRHYHQGLEAAEQGQPYVAADRYLAALDRNPGHRKARAALEAIAEDAFETRLGAGLRAEEGGDYLAARDRYAELARFVDRLDAHGLRTFTVHVDLAEKIALMEESAATREYVLGTKLLGARRWSEAIERFEAALRIKPGFRDAADKVVQAQYGWAEEELGAGRYREAARRFELVREPLPRAGRRAAEIYAALGRHHLSAGACRQAWRDLDRARSLRPGVLAQELAHAWDCATVELVVGRFEGPRDRVGGVHLPSSLQGAVLDRLPEATSDFVVLVDGSAPSFDVVLDGRVVAASVERHPARTVDRTTPGLAEMACTAVGDDGMEYEEPCEVELDVLFTEVTERKTASLSASVRLVEAAGRRVAASRTFDASAADEVHWARDFRDAQTGAWLDVTADPGTGAAVSSEVLELRDARQSLKADAELVREALDQLVRDVVDFAAAELDREVPPTDPRALPIVEL